MKDGDYLWCLVHILLDREEALERLCPDCRDRAARPLCPVCGREVGEKTGWQNPAFDEARFLALKRGERP